MWQAYFSIQLLGADGSGCVYGTPSDPNGGYLSAWYGDEGTAAAPQLGLFFPTTITSIPNYLGVGVGNDPNNVGGPNSMFSANCNPVSQCQANWTAIPSGAATWYAATTPSPYITLPVSAWPVCPGGVMTFAGANYTTTAGAVSATMASGAVSVRATAGAAALLAAALAALVL